MDTKEGRRIKILNLFLVIFLLSCGNHSNDNTMIITLDTVVSNYPVQEVDTIKPLPRIYFILNFKNEGQEVQTYSFPNSIKNQPELSNTFFATMSCPNGQIFKLPLYQNTSKPLYLKPGEEDSKSFTANPLLIESTLSKCESDYLGELIEIITKKITFTYITNSERKDFQCIRGDFEAPDYFMIE